MFDVLFGSKQFFISIVVIKFLIDIEFSVSLRKAFFFGRLRKQDIDLIYFLFLSFFEERIELKGRLQFIVLILFDLFCFKLYHMNKLIDDRFYFIEFVEEV